MASRRSVPKGFVFKSPRCPECNASYGDHNRVNGRVQHQRDCMFGAARSARLDSYKARVGYVEE